MHPDVVHRDTGRDSTPAFKLSGSRVRACAGTPASERDCAARGAPPEPRFAWLRGATGSRAGRCRGRGSAWSFFGSNPGRVKVLAAGRPGNSQSWPIAPAGRAAMVPRD